MRDLVVLAIVLGSVPICLFSPFYGLLVWVWIAYFNPHRFTFGVAFSFPVALTIAVPTLVGTLFTKKINRGIILRETILLLALWAWFVVTYVHATQVPAFAHHVPDGRLQLMSVSKILLMTVWMVLLVTSKEKMRYLYLVTGLSLGALAVKATQFGFRTGGESRVWGPPESFLGDNNDFGLAMNMALPMLFYMAKQEERKWLRWVLWICCACAGVTAILTYSRGALLGLATVIAVLAAKSRHKILAAAMVLVSAWLLLSFAPQRWMTRMDPFFGGQLDRSAEERINAWNFALKLVGDYPITGGGFEAFDRVLFSHYQPGPLPFQGPHSIYFQMLGEQGWVGLTLYLSLLGSCLWSLRALRRKISGMPESHMQWMVPYSHMIEVSLLGYMVSGAFLGRAYFDLHYQLIATTIILRVLFRREVAFADASEREALTADTVEATAV
jgi:putative inorganic carbon (HCO3(-)) transporter